MLESKHLNKIVFTLVILGLVLTFSLIALKQDVPMGSSALYESKLFADEIAQIDITVDEDDWQSLLDNPLAKEYIRADVKINGELFSSVGLRTKGNSSLSQVAQNSQSDRYSLNFNFSKYEKGQTYYGLDTFSINNMVGDTTYMKDYLAYDIMNWLGVPTPLTNYAKVTVNGQDYGFCLLLERYDKAFLGREYGQTGGQLYNVKIQMGNQGNRGQERMPENPPENMQPEEGGSIPGRAGDFPGGGRGGGDLIYIDDEVDSYPSIFDNAIFGNNSKKDQEKVIKAIKNLNEGSNLEEYFELDEILAYLAGHTFMVNLDSFSSSMTQNYYIYELDGKISILPWDYGLSLGGFQGGRDTDTTINFPIDTPVSGVSMEDRPLINKLLEVEEYKEIYHSYLDSLVEEYIFSGHFEEMINNLDAKIKDYVKNDVTAFVSYEEYESSLQALKEVVLLRAESIRGQLDGTVPSTTEEQKTNSDSLISSDSNLSLNDLGSFMGGRGAMGGGGGRENFAGRLGQDGRQSREGQDFNQRPSGNEPPEFRGEMSGPGNQENAGEDRNFIPPDGSNQANYSGATSKKGMGILLILLSILVLAGTLFVYRWR